MDKRIFRYFYILLIFLIIVNINIISAGEIDQDANSISHDILSDSAGIDEVLSADETVTSDLESDDENSNANLETNDEDSNLETDTDTEVDSETSQAADTQDNANKTVSKDKLKKASLTTKIFVIKGNYLNVYLKNSAKKGIANEKVALRLNGKTLSAITNSQGMAKFKINEPGKTYKTIMKFYGNSIYATTNKTFNLRVIAKPIYAKLTLGSYGVIVNNSLKVYLKTKAGKAISKQSVLLTFDGRTYNRTTNKNGLATLKINRASKIYDLALKFYGKGNYVPTAKTTKINVFNSKLIGKNSNGKVFFQGIIGNRSSKIKIAYVVGLHPQEHQAHDYVYKVMTNKVNMKYKYYIYRIVVTKKSGDYSKDRMRGQLLAKNYIVPHAKKQKFNLVIDIHSTTGVSYAKTYFIHVPKNKHSPSMKLAKKTIATIKSIEKNSKMLYWSPPTQTSPPYIHLPLIKAGTPTFVFETWTYEKKSVTNKRAKILTTAVDKIFG